MSKINHLKKHLSQSFSVKALEAAKQILGINILRDRNANKKWLSQEKYIKKVLQRFNMKNARIVSYPFANHFRLSSKHSPSSNEEN